MTDYSKTSKLFCVVLLIVGIFLTSCTSGYKNDGKEVTWHSWNEGSGHNEWKVPADPKTFEVLDDTYARDAKHAFYKGNIVKGADGKSFRSCGKWYAADSHRVYMSGEPTQVKDPASLKVHSSYLVEDKYDYYWRGQALHVEDKASFALVGDGDRGTHWAVDNNNAYDLSGNVIHGIDRATFRASNTDRGCSGSYAQDKHRVFFHGKIVQGADPATFREVDFYVGQDKHRVYNQDQATSISDYKALTPIGRMFTDGKHIYDYILSTIPFADAATFEVIDNEWYKDKKHVWHGTTLISHADPKTFVPVSVYDYRKRSEPEFLHYDHNYGKDARYVFIRDSIIIGADPESFEKMDFHDADSWTVFDKNRVYQGISSPNHRKYLKEKYGK